jgi:hypothetical protein
MTEREQRLRQRIDQLIDERDQAREQLAECRARSRRYWERAWIAERSRDIWQLRARAWRPLSKRPVRMP